MKIGEREAVTSREEAFKMCAQLYQELHSYRINNNNNTNSISSVNTEAPPFLKRGVEKILKEMEQKQAPRNEQLTCDNTKLGGNECLTQTIHIFNTVLKTKKIPPECKKPK